MKTWKDKTPGYLSDGGPALQAARAEEEQGLLNKAVAETEVAAKLKNTKGNNNHHQSTQQKFMFTTLGVLNS